MRADIDNKRNNACGPVEWINANFELKESSLLDFLYDAGSQPEKYKATIYRTRRSRKKSLSLNGKEIYGFSTHVRSGYYTGISSLEECWGWYPSALAYNLCGFRNFTTGTEITGQIANRNDMIETLSINIRHGLPLPFEDNRFDAVTIASSIEQIPGFASILQEVYRILKPKGQLRLEYDTLENCDDRYSHRLWICGGIAAEAFVRLILCDISKDREHVQHYGFLVDISKPELSQLFGQAKTALLRPSFSIEALQRLKDRIREVVVWKTQCPCCKSLLRMLKDIGFKSVKPSSLAEDVFERFSRQSNASLREATVMARSREEAFMEEVVLTVDLPTGFPRQKFRTYFLI